MTVIDGLLIFFSIILAYFIITKYLSKKGILEKYNISFYGPALLLRTTKGVSFLKKIARKKRFWKAFGSFAVVFCFIAMVIMTFILIWQVWAIMGFTPEQKAALPGPEVALVLPGINPILPLEFIGYILFALAVAIIVHEFSHGILTFAGNLKVKSLGILYMIVPLGAFCEPDEEELKKTKTAKRMRVYAAGPMSNFVVAFICILLFSFVFMSAVQPGEGLSVYDVAVDSPAYDEGIVRGSIITEINGTNLQDYPDLTDKMLVYYTVLNQTQANDTITVSFIKNKVTYNNQEFKLKDAYLYDGENASKGKGSLGIISFIKEKDNLARLQNPFQKPENFLVMYVLPLMGYFQGYNPIVAPFTDSYVITGPLGVLPDGLFWMIVNTLYWLFWLNFAVGLFNVLPMVPLDGGFLFNDAISSLVKKFKKGITDERRDQIVKNVSLVISLTILFAIIAPFILKYV